MKFYHIGAYHVCGQTQLLDRISAAISHSLECHDQDEYDWHRCRCVLVHNKFLGWRNIDHLKQCQQYSVHIDIKCTSCSKYRDQSVFIMPNNKYKDKQN